MAVDVIMPQMGESIFEGTITKWLKKPGDKVERDEPLFEISTDKVDAEIPAPAAGVLKEIKVNEGQTVPIQTVVAVIDAAGAATAAAPAAAPAKAEAGVAAAKPAASEPAPSVAKADSAAVLAASAAAPASAPPSASGSAPENGRRIHSSPLVRRMARESNIDLNTVSGTGAGGRISKQDLEAYMSAQGARTMEQVHAPSAQPAQPAAPAPAAPATPSMPRAEAPRTRIEPMSTMRQKIAEHMVMSKRTSAHVTTVHKTDMTKIAKLRERHKGEFQQRHGYSLTYLPFVIAAAVEAINDYPIVNASIEGSNIIYHNEINVGIAVALENGLIVPVIRNADEKNVTGLQRAVVDLSTRARSRQLKPDEVQGGTFSITNFGSFGSVFATPVINQPQVAILGVGAVEKTPVVIEDAIAIRSVAYLALTFDHRLIDGAVADQFTGKVKSILENWSGEIL